MFCIQDNVPQYSISAFMLSTLLYDVEIRGGNFSIQILKTEDACGGNLERKSPKAMVTKDMLDPEVLMTTGGQVGGRVPMKTRLYPTDQVKGNFRCFKMKNALLYLNQDCVGF